MNILLRTLNARTILIFSSMAVLVSCHDDDQIPYDTFEDCPIMYQAYSDCECEDIGRVQWGEHTCYPEIEGEAYVGTPSCGCGVEMIIEMRNTTGEYPRMHLYLKEGLINQALANRGDSIEERRQAFWSQPSMAPWIVGTGSYDYIFSLWDAGYRCHISEQFGWNSWVDFGLNYHEGIDALEGTMLIIGDPDVIPPDSITRVIDRCDFTFSRLEF